jgi:hypothetical protein
MGYLKGGNKGGGWPPKVAKQLAEFLRGFVQWWDLGARVVMGLNSMIFLLLFVWILCINAFHLLLIKYMLSFQKKN